jgi:hypothetical protein
MGYAIIAARRLDAPDALPRARVYVVVDGVRRAWRAHVRPHDADGADAAAPCSVEHI